MDKNTGKSKSFVLLPVFWLLITLLLLGGATFAWFTFTSYTNVTPMAGTIGNGGANLLISNDPYGEFAETAELIINGTSENLQPVSTCDLQFWYTAVSHNSSGITNRFKDCTETIDEWSLFGSVYLKSEGGDCDVYLNPQAMSFTGDEQLLAACRLGLTVSSQSMGEEVFIFNLDSIVNSSGVEAKNTTEQEQVVVASVDDAGTATLVSDPSVTPEAYGAAVDGEVILPAGDPLCRVTEGELVTVEYRLYMEGCDENSINAVQDKEVTFSLAFAGVGAPKTANP